MNGSLQILCAGASTPIGHTLPANAAACRAGLNAFTRPPFFRDQRSGDAVNVSALATLNGFAAAERMLALARTALEETCRPLSSLSLRIGLLSAAGEARPGFAADTARHLCQRLAMQIPGNVVQNCCLLQLAGSAGGMLLLQSARDFIEQESVDVCLLCGIDSYMEIEAIHWLENSGRLKTGEQPNGVIPGEGAAVLAIASAQTAARLGLRGMAEISGVATAAEPRPWYRREATLGQGLTDSLRRTFRASGSVQADAVYGEINGETWRTDEWGYAYLRNADRVKSPLRVFHPASSWGETGGASTPLLLALAAYGLNRPSRNDQSVLVWSASGATSLRGSCLLRKVAN